MGRGEHERERPPPLSLSAPPLAPLFSLPSPSPPSLSLCPPISHLVVVQVPQRLSHGGRFEDLPQRPRHVQGDGEAGEEEEGAAIVARPVAVGGLEGGVEGRARVQGGGGGGLVRRVPAGAGGRRGRARGRRPVRGRGRRGGLEAEQGVGRVLGRGPGRGVRGAGGLHGRPLRLRAAGLVVRPHLAAGVAVQGGQVRGGRARGGGEAPHLEGGEGRQRRCERASERERREKQGEKKRAGLVCCLLAHTDPGGAREGVGRSDGPRATRAR